MILDKAIKVNYMLISIHFSTTILKEKTYIINMLLLLHHQDLYIDMYITDIGQLDVCGEIKWHPHKCVCSIQIKLFVFSFKRQVMAAIRTSLI